MCEIAKNTHADCGAGIHCAYINTFNSENSFLVTALLLSPTHPMHWRTRPHIRLLLHRPDCMYGRGLCSCCSVSALKCRSRPADRIWYFHHAIKQSRHCRLARVWNSCRNQHQRAGELDVLYDYFVSLRLSAEYSVIVLPDDRAVLYMTHWNRAGSWQLFLAQKAPPAAGFLS